MLRADRRDRGRPRRFTLLDVMVLIAAIALGLMVPAAVRGTIPEAEYRIYDARQHRIVVGASWLLIASTGLALVAFLGPRPDLRRWIRRPGILAMALILLSLAYLEVQNLAFGVTNLLTTGRTFDWPAFSWLFGPVLVAARINGLAVAAGWFTLATTGQWRPSRDWLDRSGRLVGLSWIIIGLGAWILENQTIAM